jgi:hypothetical protein
MQVLQSRLPATLDLDVAPSAVSRSWIGRVPQWQPALQKDVPLAAASAAAATRFREALAGSAPTRLDVRRPRAETATVFPTAGGAPAAAAGGFWTVSFSAEAAAGASRKTGQLLAAAAGRSPTVAMAHAAAAVGWRNGACGSGGRRNGLPECRTGFSGENPAKSGAAATLVAVVDRGRSLGASARGGPHAGRNRVVP